MSIKGELTKIMSDLLIIDDKLKDLNKKGKDLREQRNNIESHLMETLKKHNLEDKKFILNNKQLFLNKTSTLPLLNIKLIEKILNNHLEKSKVNIIIKEIEKYRQENKKEVLRVKRKLDKKSLKKKKIY
tara:strand:+ start:120 stop:506 length:387 start_codon:yes stop_codon:yes gene_type:complete